MNLRFAHKPAKRGFTLLEVLVVVAIIALLVAILLPSLSSARHQSRRVVCQSNLRQIAVAWEMYLHDSRDHFLRGTNNETNYGGQQGKGSTAYGSNPKKPVSKPLNKYLKLDRVVRAGAEIFLCPSDAGFTGVRPTCFQYYGTSYYPNRVLIGQNQWSPQTDDPCQKAPYFLYDELNAIMPGLTRSMIEDASRVILIGDFSWKRTWDRSLPADFTYWHRTRYTHNIAFADSHVDFVRIRKGIHVTPQYTLLPTKHLRSIASDSQEEIPPP